MSKKRKEPKPVSDAAYLARLRNRKCLHCDAPRGPSEEMWCRDCVAEGARRFRLAAREPIRIWTDPRFAWPTRDEFVSWLDEPSP